MTKLNQKTILLVEDEKIIALNQCRILAEEGFLVIHASSGEEALEITNDKSIKIDLVLMDIDLGSGLDGTETAEIILQGQNVPILFLSSHMEKQIVDKTEKITSYGYVVKNSSFTVLDAAIKMAFKLFEAKEKTENEKENLNTILQSIGDAVIATDLNGDIIQMNPVSEQLTGWNFQEAKGKPLTKIFQIINSISRLPVANPVDLVLEQGVVVGLANHTILVSKIGDEYQIADSASPIRNKHGEMRGVVLVFRDVTNEYKNQQKIIDGERRAKAILEASPVPIVVNDDNQNISQLNPAFIETFGYNLSDIPNLSDWWPKAYPNPSYRDMVAETWIQRLNTAKKENTKFEPMEITVRCKNGEDKIVIAQASLLGNSFKGEHLVTLFDITKSKEAEEIIRLNVQLLEASQSIAKLGGWEFDLISGVLFWTDETYKIHDTNPQEFTPTVDAGISFYLPESQDILSRAIQLAINEGIGYDLELETYTTKGRKIDVRTTCSVTMLNGKATKLTGTFQDITKQKEMEKKLKSLLKEKEFILREVQHRIKNNMNIIVSLLSLQAEMQNDNLAKVHLQNAASRVQSMVVLYDKLYKSDNSNSLSIKLYLPSLIKEIIELFPSTYDIEILTQIEDIILNSKILSSIGILINELITNTMKYAFSNQTKGIISVTATKRDELVRIIYQDNGKGIPANIDFDNTSGFGLQLIKLLSDQMHGSIKIERENGTRFILEFEI